MKSSVVLLLLIAGLGLLANGCIVAPIPGPPPEPMVETYGVAPYPGAVWVVGDWRWHGGHRAWEWHRGYWR